MKNTAIILIRIFLGLIFFSSGMAKLFADHQFPNLFNSVWLDVEFGNKDLALYSRFIAYTQAVIGFLLITQRFATIAAILLLPMIVNILMLAVSLNLEHDVLINIFMLALNIAILLTDYHRIKFLFTDEPKKLKKIDAERNFPFHDLVFLIGMFMVMVSPFLSWLSNVVAYIAIAVGVIICFGIQYYEEELKRSLKELNKNFFD